MEQTKQFESVPTIPTTAVMPIEIGGHFYMMLKSILINLCQDVSQEDMDKIINKVKNKEALSNINEELLYVLTALIMTIEKSAKDNNQFVFKTLDEIKKEFNIEE